MVENILLKNSISKEELELDKVTTPDYILHSVDWGSIEGSHNSYKYVNQVGVYVTRTNLGTRDIEVIGWIVAENENQMTQRKMELNKFFNPQQPIDLFYKKYKIRFLPNSSIKYSAITAENNEVMCKFKIEGLCPDPLFTENSEQKITAANTIGMFHFPLIISEVPNTPGGIIFGYRQPSLIVAIENKGAISTGMTIVFKANGTLINPSLINVDTQKFFKVNKTMQAGEQITINTTIGQKKIQGLLYGELTNYFKYRDFESEWLQLEVGDNLFRYDADAQIENLEVYIYFHNKYLEVQECY